MAGCACRRSASPFYLEAKNLVAFVRWARARMRREEDMSLRAIAKQSRAACAESGLLRRFAPRNDGAPCSPVCTGEDEKRKEFHMPLWRKKRPVPQVLDE